jgi:hypothetical protein
MEEKIDMRGRNSRISPLLWSAVVVGSLAACSNGTPQGTASPSRDGYTDAIDACALVDMQLVDRIIGKPDKVVSSSPIPSADRSLQEVLGPPARTCDWTHLGDGTERGKNLWIRARVVPAAESGESGEAQAEAVYQSATRTISCVPIVVTGSSACWSGPEKDGNRKYYAGFLRKRNVFVDIGIRKFPDEPADEREIPREMDQLIKDAAAQL